MTASNFESGYHSSNPGIDPEDLQFTRPGDDRRFISNPASRLQPPPQMRGYGAPDHQSAFDETTEATEKKQVAHDPRRVEADVTGADSKPPTVTFQKRDRYLKLPDMLSLLDLYRQAVTVAVEAGRLGRRITGLSRLAINLEVLAYRQTENQAVFPVLGKELQRLARMIERAATNLASGTNDLAGHAVASAGLARRCEKFLSGADLSTNERNHQLIHRVREDQGMRFFKVLNDMNEEIKTASHAMTELERISIHIPVVATLLKIESAKCGRGGSEEIRDLSFRLLEMGTHLERDLAQIMATVQGCMKLLQSFAEER